jgi:K+-transporting ATPase ATPase C chain
MENKTNIPAVAPDGLWHHLRVSIIATLVLAVICCGIYPLIVWGLSQALFHDKANGSLISDKDGKVIGSRLIGQAFSDAKYFHPRPSAAGNGYDPTSSGGSNLGPTSAKLLFGTTKDSYFTVIAYDPSHAEAANPTGRTEGKFVGITKSDAKSTITVSVAGAAKTYDLDKDVTITAQGRTIKETTPAKDADLELKFNTATPPAVTAVTVIDKATEGTVKAVDTDAGKITLPADKSGDPDVDFVIPATGTLVVVNGKADAKPADIPVGAKVRILTATVMDYDGIADRVIHYCEDNDIEYASAVLVASFKDADGLDDVKLISAFGAASDRKITPKEPIPADAVTASGCGLDPHISFENAAAQMGRVIKARGNSALTKEKLKQLIDDNTDGPNLGILGDAGVNVLMLNLALDKDYPAAAAAPVPATQPATQPAANKP